MKTKILLMLLCAASVFTAKAQVTFPQDYNQFFSATANGTGVLEQTATGLDNWKVSTSTSVNGGVNPSIAANTLSYSAYVDNLLGQEIALAPVTTTPAVRSSFYQFTFSYTELTTLYVSFLLNVSIAPATTKTLVTFDRSNGNTSRIRASIIASGGGYALSCSVDGTPYSPLSSELSLNTTYLVVLKANITTPSTTAGAGTATLFINPTLGAAEPTSTVTISDAGVTSLDGIRSLIINQTAGTEAKIAGLRVSTNWADVCKGGGTTTALNKLQSNTQNIYAANKEIISKVAGNLKVYSLSGVELLSAKTEGKYSTKLNSGLYLVRFTDNSGVSSVAKIQL